MVYNIFIVHNKKNNFCTNLIPYANLDFNGLCLRLQTIMSEMWYRCGGTRAFFDAAHIALVDISVQTDP